MLSDPLSVMLVPDACEAVSSLQKLGLKKFEQNDLFIEVCAVTELDRFCKICRDSIDPIRNEAASADNRAS